MGTETVTAPTTNEVNVIVPSVIAQSYLMKMILFAVMIGVIAWYIRRRRSSTELVETEKSIP